VLDGDVDEGLGEGLKLETVVDGGFECGGILGWDALTLVGAVFPDLVFKVGPGLGA
jgi:hypothetical protein